MKSVKVEKINMFWHKVPFGKKNFGDVLGPYIVGKMSGQEIMYTSLLHKGFNKISVLTYLRAIYNRKLSVKELYYNIQYITDKKTNLLITIGSVIDWFTNPDTDIWGSGIMNRDSHITNANFYAVRGKYSQLRLKELGYNVPEAIGDPALLTPLIYKPESKKKYSLGIIPHFLHYDEIHKNLNWDKILIINLLDDIEKIIEEVHSCEKIISSSLHGIVIGHAYGIPSLWFWLSKDHIGGDNIKFADYFSSVDINEYDYFKINRERYDRIYIDQVESIFEENQQLTLVNPALLKKIQVDLINSAPFSILPQYKNFKQKSLLIKI